jgi:hypothetical protein
MLNVTEDIIKAALKSDPSLTSLDRKRIIGALRNSGNKPPVPAPDPATERIVRREECAMLLSGSLRLVDRLATERVLKRVTLPGRKRATGFLYSDVMALLRQQKAA